MISSSEAAASTVDGGRSKLPRRQWSLEEKRRIMVEVLQPGASVAKVARHHGVNANLVFNWRKTVSVDEPILPSGTSVQTPSAMALSRAATAEEGAAQTFIPIGIFGRTEDERPAMVAQPPTAHGGQTLPERTAMSQPPAEARVGMIEINLPDGTRVRVDAFVNERALRRVLAVLKAVS